MRFPLSKLLIEILGSIVMSFSGCESFLSLWALGCSHWAEVGVYGLFCSTHSKWRHFHMANSPSGFILFVLAVNHQLSLFSHTRSENQTGLLHPHSAGLAPVWQPKLTVTGSVPSSFDSHQSLHFASQTQLESLLDLSAIHQFIHVPDFLLYKLIGCPQCFTITLEDLVEDHFTLKSFDEKLHTTLAGPQRPAGRFNSGLPDSSQRILRIIHMLFSLVWFSFFGVPDLSGGTTIRLQSSKSSVPSAFHTRKWSSFKHDTFRGFELAKQLQSESFKRK